MREQPGQNTRPHARLPSNFLGLDAWITLVALSRKLRGSSMCFAYICDITSMGVSTTRHGQTSGRLVQQLKVRTVATTCSRGLKQSDNVDKIQTESAPVLGKICEVESLHRSLSTIPLQISCIIKIINSLLKVSLIQTTISVKTPKHEWVKTRRISRSKIWFAYSADILSCTKCVGRASIVHDRTPD